MSSAASSALAPPPAAVAKALDASLHSPCLSKRGVSVWDPATLKVVATGYNWKLPGDACTGDARCKGTCSKSAVHAEQSALLMLGRNAGNMDMLHVKTVDGALVASGPPSCVECSKLIAAACIAGMWLYHQGGWRRYTAAEFHRLSLEAT